MRLPLLQRADLLNPELLCYRVCFGGVFNNVVVKRVAEGSVRPTRYGDLLIHDPQRIELKYVDGYKNIQIHVGNDTKDVKGCFAVGTDRGADKVTGSKDAMGKINDIVKADGGKITVKVEGSPTKREKKK